MAVGSAHEAEVLKQQLLPPPVGHIRGAPNQGHRGEAGSHTVGNPEKQLQVPGPEAELVAHQALQYNHMQRFSLSTGLQGEGGSFNWGSKGERKGKFKTIHLMQLKILYSVSFGNLVFGRESNCLKI